MDNYWFLYKKDTGEIYGAPYKGSVEEWMNIPDGCDVLGAIPEDDPTATDAWNNPSYYRVKDSKLVPVDNIDALRAAQQALINAPKPPSLEDQLKTMQDAINSLLGL